MGDLGIGDKTNGRKRLSRQHPNKGTPISNIKRWPFLLDALSLQTPFKRNALIENRDQSKEEYYIYSVHIVQHHLLPALAKVRNLDRQSKH